jgi:hypothetical protein
MSPSRSRPDNSVAEAGKVQDSVTVKQQAETATLGAGQVGLTHDLNHDGSGLRHPARRRDATR